MLQVQVGMLQVQVGMQHDLLSKQGAALEMAARAAMSCVKRMMPGDDASWEAMLADLPSLPKAVRPSSPGPDVSRCAPPPPLTLPPSPGAFARLRPRRRSRRRRPHRRRFDSAPHDTICDSSAAVLPALPSWLGSGQLRSSSPSGSRSSPQRPSPPLYGSTRVSPSPWHAVHNRSLLACLPSCIHPYGLTSRAGWQRRARGCAGWTYL